MNKTLTTTLTVLAVLALAGIIFFAGSMYARSNMMFGWSNNTYGPATMNRMMGGTNGMMNGPGGMMNRYGFSNANLTPLTIDQVKAGAEQYLARLNNPDLEIAEIMIFDNNGYVIVREASTGLGAFELLVDPASQIAYPEHGPNMMWNLKYGALNHDNMMGGSGGMMGRGIMMGGYGNMMGNWDGAAPLDVSAKMTVTPEQAVGYAQQYLNENIAGAVVEHPIQFYGYYTLDFKKDGKITGMLSVNGYSGQVFLHTWHGAFVEETEFE